MEKSLDSHGRWRKKIVAFRVSEEEARQSRNTLSAGCVKRKLW